MVQKTMLVVAKGLDKASRGYITPNMVTMVGLFMHGPIALLIARGNFVWAAILLVVFGLFDTLDGQLAKLQGRTSQFGMLFDSVSDRAKEAFLYIGISYYLVESAASDGKGFAYFAVLAVTALGGSMLISYVNAWGEVVAQKNTKVKRQVNQAFRLGLMRYEVRMFLIAGGLLFDWLFVAVVIIALFTWATALERFVNISLWLSER